jgi:hypothetical protein
MAVLTYEEFEQLWDLNPSGTKENVFLIVKQFLSGSPRGKDGIVLTFDLFYKEYKNYVEFLEPYQKGGFTKSGFEIQGLQAYIDKAIYMKTFQKPKKLRDFYLFGEFKEDFLRMRLKEFKGRFK